MARITMTLCDVGPCTLIAEREFEVNGQTIYVCGENCFVKFWSREFGNWKEERYHMAAHLDSGQEEVKIAILNHSGKRTSDLQLLRPAKNAETVRYVARVES